MLYTRRLFSSAGQANKQIRLAKRPIGLPSSETWTLVQENVIKPQDGGIVVQVSMVSIDPAMRGWLNEGKSYVPPVAIGDVMRAIGIGRY